MSFHKVTNKRSPAPDPGAEQAQIPSLSPAQWPQRRKQLLHSWTQILGKLEPAPADRHWFGDIRKARELQREDRGKYTRIRIELPIEIDFWQPHLLLVPKGKGPFPAVITWTSTTPDYLAPEQWWGEWLASHGYVVLTGWSFIRNYRDNSNWQTGVEQKVYERFGRWACISKMVHDVRREAEYLRSLKEVDRRRIGFMGFSLSAKTAVYVGAFAPEISVVVSLDPHIAINGGTNWFSPWYLDWTRKWPDIPTPDQTVLSLLDKDPTKPGFDHDHHELLALAAPKPFLLIGGSQTEDAGGDSDDLESWGYVNRAAEVYKHLGVPEKLQYVSTNDGHKPNGPHIDPAWQGWFERWLKGLR